MSVVRKVQPKVKIETPQVEEEENAAKQAEPAKQQPAVSKKHCGFCVGGAAPVYWNAQQLRRFVSDRGRIIPRSRSGVCAKHQRRLAVSVKHARILSLLPYTAGV